MDKQQSRNGNRPDTAPAQYWPASGAISPRPRQRTSIRKALPCTLQLRFGQTHLLTQSVHDLSLTGVFVEMDPKGILIGDPVEVTIEFADQGGQPVQHAITAEVVRVTPEGVGLKFDQYGNRAYTDLLNILY